MLPEPTATIEFKDGHREESIAVFMFTNDDWIVVTTSGAYRPQKTQCVNWFFLKPIQLSQQYCFQRYDSRFLEAEISSGGGVTYDSSGCWVCAPFVERVLFRAGNQELGEY